MGGNRGRWRKMGGKGGEMGNFEKLPKIHSRKCRKNV